ncbi:trigger factor [Patescibacteria group bacterium]|nr:MAG: trigger factor [Patescibacteria group bacterium]
MAIERKIEKLPHAEVAIEVTLPWEEWKNFILPATEELSKDMQVPGFRAGKVPRHVVEQKFGQNAVLERAAEKAIQKTHEKIIEEEKLDAIGSPKAEILKLAEGNELCYRVVTAVVPTVKLGEWSAAVKKVNAEFAAKPVTVTDEEADEEIKKVASSRAKLVTVNRAAAQGDSVLVDFVVKRNGVPIENGTGQNHPLVLGQNVFIPGFEEAVVGMNAGESKDIELSFPTEYHAKDLAGKPATFSVKLNLVQERSVPELNDEFAKSLGQFDNFGTLRNSVREGMTEERQHEQREKRRNAIVDVLVEKSEIDLPEVLVHQEIHRMIDEFKLQVQSMGMTFEQYLTGIKKTAADLEHDWEPQAEKRVKASLILEHLVTDQSIEIPQEELEEEMNKTLQRFKKVKHVEKDLDMQRLYTYTRSVLANQKLLEQLEKM